MEVLNHQLSFRWAMSCSSEADAPLRNERRRVTGSGRQLVARPHAGVVVLGEVANLEGDLGAEGELVMQLQQGFALAGERADRPPWLNFPWRTSARRAAAVSAVASGQCS